MNRLQVMFSGPKDGISKGVARDVDHWILLLFLLSLFTTNHVFLC